MPFPFSSLCALFNELEAHKLKDPPYHPRDLETWNRRTIVSWFNRNQATIHAHHVNGAALLSALFPEKRTDRVFWIQAATLTRVLKRVLRLGRERQAVLDEWTKHGRGDLGICVERVIKQTEAGASRRPRGALTVEEMDDVFTQLSGFRDGRQDAASTQALISRLYNSLSSKEAKWLTRLILKDLSPLVIPANLVLGSFHFLLPDLLKVQDNFDAAVEMLKCDDLKHLPPRPAPGTEANLRIQAAEFLRPKIGVKIGRPAFLKARSLKHCGDMAAKRYMYAQRKYDGEYCQVHVDISKGQDCIKIFAKSGKDATRDRFGIHDAIRKGLRIGARDCAFSSRCVVEGELLVYSDKEKRIMDFHKIRKYVSRSGFYIGTEMDSQPHESEHLMIVFHDILVLDDNFILTKRYMDRFALLRQVLEPVEGHAQLWEGKLFKFSMPDALADFRRYFTKAIVNRWEGLVLKPDDVPYFSFRPGGDSSAWIKLKKDYIFGLGDTADLAIIGASFDAQEGEKLKHIKRLKWTSFHVGCLINREQACRFGAKPVFREVDVLKPPNVSRYIRLLNELGNFVALDYKWSAPPEEYTIQHDRRLRIMTTFFKKPFVAEVMGAGFEKPSGANYWVIRFPRMQKLHEDRTFVDTVDFEELQQLGQEAQSIPKEQMSQEEYDWMVKMRASCPEAEYREETQDSYVTTERTETTPGKSPGKSPGSGVSPFTSPASISHASPRSRARISPCATRASASPMVRMDSGEMRPGEKRVPGGAVVVKDLAKVISTPPSTAKEKGTVSPPNKRKLSGDSARDVQQRTKKAKNSHQQTSDMPPPRVPGTENVQPASHSMPLSSVDNASQKRKAASPTARGVHMNNMVKDVPPAKPGDEQPNPAATSSTATDSGQKRRSSPEPPSPERPRKRRKTPTIEDVLAWLDIQDAKRLAVERLQTTNPQEVVKDADSQGSLQSAISTDYEGEELTYDEYGNPKMNLFSTCLELCFGRPTSPELGDPQTINHPRFAAIQKIKDATLALESVQDGSMDGEHTKAIEEALTVLKGDPLYQQPHPVSTQSTTLQADIDQGAAQAFNRTRRVREDDTGAITLPTAPLPPPSTSQTQLLRLVDPRENFTLNLTPENTSLQSRPTSASGHLPVTWPPSLGFKLPDPSVVYNPNSACFLLTLLDQDARQKVGDILDAHFQKATDFRDEIPNPLTPMESFCRPQTTPLVKIILLDSRAPSFEQTFLEHTRDLTAMFRQWKEHSWLPGKSGKIMLLDYRAVVAAGRLVTVGELEEGLLEHVKSVQFEPGVLEDSPEKRTFLGRLWKRNWFLGALIWGPEGEDGEMEIGVVFDREECL